MTRTQFETGFSRLYQVAWLLLFTVALLIAIDEGHRNPGDAVVSVIASAFGPWVIAKMGKWVYRGFVPKD